MSNLRERLDDLVIDVPLEVVPDIASARTVGDRRRRVRRGLSVVLVAAVTLLCGLVGVRAVTAPAPQPAESERPPSVSGYPERVTAPWWVRDLPDQTEPLAGVFEADSGNWFALGEHGEVYQLDFLYTGSGNFPSISPDGTKIAYVGHDWRVAIRDVVTGDVVTFPTVSGGKEIPGATLFWTAQAPAAWSPDGTHLLVQGGSLGRAKPQYGNVVLGTDGTVAPVVPNGNPAGWLDLDHALLFDSQGSLITVDRAGQQVASVAVKGLSSRKQLNQFSPVVTADAETLLITTISDATRTARTTSWDPLTGHQLRGNVDTSGVNTWCPSSRTPKTITFASGGYDSALHVEVAGGSSSLLMIDPALEPTCVLLADHALAGQPTGSLVARFLSGFTLGPVQTSDLRDTWVAWHLRYAGAALLAVLTLLVARAGRRRYRQGSFARGAA